MSPSTAHEVEYQLQHTPGAFGDEDASHAGDQDQSNLDPYYTNEDIGILHAIVTAAQTHLDRAPQPKPLPATVLFKAYDDVLPDHGVDPDSDHHLSKFIFRVGGEHGPGNLIHKFQTILERMGIVLEFGENTIGSQKSLSPPLSPISPQQRRFSRDLPDSKGISTIPPTLSRSHKTHESPVNRLLDPSRELTESTGPHRYSITNPEITSKIPQSDSIENEATGMHLEYRPTINQPEHFPSSIPVVSSEDRLHEGDVSSSTRRATLLTAMNLWRNAAAKQQERDQGSSRLISDSHNNIPHSGSRELRGTVPSDGFSTVGELHEESKFGPKSPARSNGSNDEIHVPHIRSNSKTKNEETPKLHANNMQDEQLLHRATRTRQIYLASRVFNHWADRTATRLQREAVARRHMVRYRCFQGWSKTPTSKLPALDHLWTSAAVQKLRRAVVQQEEQLNAAVTATAEAYRLRMARRVLEHWLGHLLKRFACQRAVSRSKSRELASWMAETSKHTTLQRDIKLRNRLEGKMNMVAKWHHQANNSAARLQLAQQVGTVHQCFIHLRVWWEQAQIKRRARDYKRDKLVKTVDLSVQRWSLQARSQAFCWNHEYGQTRRVLATWLNMVQQSTSRVHQSKQELERWRFSKFKTQLLQENKDYSTLSYLQQRALLYIRATRTLQVFATAVAQRKKRNKAEVRKQLMCRYREASSARKTRGFYRTLDHWRQLATQQLHLTQLARSNAVANTASQRQKLVIKWHSMAANGHQSQLTSEQYLRRTKLDVWHRFSEHCELGDAQAWEMFTTVRQRRCLKGWSISSLQRGGQAHTATMVHQRYSREKRNRALQSWRQRRLEKNSLFGGGLHHPPMTEPVGRYRSSWRALSARRSLVRRGPGDHDFLASPMQTPTRWTGLPLPLEANLSSRPMPPVKEAEEEHTTYPDAAGDYRGRGSPSELRTSTFAPANLPSTTPLVPIPNYMEQEFRPQYQRSGNLRSERKVRSIDFARSAPSVHTSPSIARK